MYIEIRITDLFFFRSIMISVNNKNGLKRVLSTLSSIECYSDKYWSVFSRTKYTLVLFTVNRGNNLQIISVLLKFEHNSLLKIKNSIFYHERNALNSIKQLKRIKCGFLSCEIGYFVTCF